MTNDTCPSLEWYLHANHILTIGTYYVGTLLYFIFGMLGHITCLFSFYKQAKTDNAYRYQIFLTANETVEIVAYLLASICVFWFSGFSGTEGAKWFRSNYTLMWFASHIAIMQLNMLITNSLLLSLAVVADRLFALTKPFVYKAINHKCHQNVAITVCFVLGIATSIFGYFQFTATLDQETGLYTLEINVPFVTSDIANILAQIRNAVRVFSLIALVISNTVLVVLYRKRNNKVTKLTSTVDKKKKERKDMEKTLTFLTIFQCLFNSISMLALVSFYAAFYILPSFSVCESLLWAPLLDGTLQFLDLADLYVVFSISKKFRQIIFTSVPLVGRFFLATCCKSEQQPITIQTNTH